MGLRRRAPRPGHIRIVIWCGRGPSWTILPLKLLRHPTRQRAIGWPPSYSKPIRAPLWAANAIVCAWGLCSMFRPRFMRRELPVRRFQHRPRPRPHLPASRRFWPPLIILLRRQAVRRHGPMRCPDPPPNRQRHRCRWCRLLCPRHSRRRCLPPALPPRRPPPYRIRYRMPHRIWPRRRGNPA